MSLKKLVIALVVAATVLLTSVVLGSWLANRGAAGSVAAAVAKHVEDGAVVATFFLLCFVVAQAVHVWRSRSRPKVG